MEGDRLAGEGKLDDECMLWTKPRRGGGGGKGLLIQGKLAIHTLSNLVGKYYTLLSSVICFGLKLSVEVCSL